MMVSEGGPLGGKEVMNGSNDKREPTELRSPFCHVRIQTGVYDLMRALSQIMLAPSLILPVSRNVSN